MRRLSGLAALLAVASLVGGGGCASIRHARTPAPYDFDHPVFNERDVARGPRRPAAAASQRVPNAAPRPVRSSPRLAPRLAPPPKPVARFDSQTSYPSDAAKLRVELAAAQVGETRYERGTFVARILEAAGQSVQVAAGERYVPALRAALAARGQAHVQGSPRAGDLIFLSNTHDENRNGRPDDPLTLAGFVERVEGDTLVFIAFHGGKVRRLAVTPARPHQQRDERSQIPLNTRLVSWNGGSGGGPELAGECWAGWATLEP